MVVGGFLRLFDVGKNAAHAIQIGLACRRQREAARRSLKQPHAQVIFEVPDEARHRWGRNAELAGARGKAVLGHHLLEHHH
jgi:hypothetical protein